MTDNGRQGHTELPWAVRAPDSPGFSGGLRVDCPKGEAVAKVWGCDDEAQANAAFIVRACNSHYALLEALEAAEAHFGPFAEITINGQHDPDDVRVVALIRTTIRLAHGEEQ